MTSEIRTNSITSRAGMSTVTMTDSGPMFSGITTFVDNSGFTFGVGGGTSIFTPATNVLTFGTNNTEKIRIDASGNTNIAGVTTSSNFKTGTSNVHSTGFECTNVNASGIITASNFKGDGSQLTGISAGTSLSGSTNNTVCTVTGANAIQGEAGLTYDGSKLSIKGVDTATGSGGPAALEIKQGDANNEFVNLALQTGSGGPLAVISAIADATGVYPNTTGQLTFNTQVGGGVFERLRIAANGNIGIGNDASFPVYTHINSRNFMLGTGSESTALQIHSANNLYGGIYFGDVADRTDANSYIGSIEYKHGNDYMNFRTNGSERLRIDSSGKVGINQTNPGAFDKFVVQGTGNVIAAQASSGAAGIGFYESNTGRFFLKTLNGSDGLSFVDGDNSSERLRISSNGNIGIGNRTSSPDQLLHVHTSSGDAVIHVEAGADPKLRLRAHSGESIIQFADASSSNTGEINYVHSGDYLKFQVNASERMRINSDGTVYFSQNMSSQSPSGGQFGFRMDRGGGNGTIMNIENYSNDSVNNNAGIKLVTNHSNVRIIHHNQGGFYVIQSASGYLHYYQNGVSRVYIDTNGRVGVNYTGTAGWAEQLNVRGTYGSGEYAIAAHITHSQGSLMRFGTSSGLCGSIYGNGTGCSFNTSSDYRLKENDVNITDGISRVKQLRPIRFNWKSDPSKIEDGFFAHEVSPVVPESVTGEKDAEIDEIGEGYQKIDHSKLVPLLTASLKEIIAKVETLEQENIALRARVTNLEGN